MRTEERNVWSLYVSDANLALQAIEQSLLALERDGDNPSEVNRLYRGLHTLKGNSALLELTQAETLAHTAEDVVGFVREGGARMDRPTVDLMLGVVDLLRAVVVYVADANRDVGVDVVEPKLEELRAWLRAHDAAPREKLALPDADGGVHLFSDRPPAKPGRDHGVTEVDIDTLGMLLQLARELCFPDGVLLQTTEELRGLIETLGPAAERLRVGELATRITELAAAVDAGATTVRPKQLVPLCRTLTDLESRYRGQASDPQTFDFAGLSERAFAAAQSGELSPSTAQDEDEPRPQPSATSSETPAERQEFLRIDARRVSHVMDLAGEVGLACSAVTHHPELEGRELEGFAAAAHKLEMLIRELQSEVSAMRLVPIASIFQAMHRVCRDTARRTGKEVELIIRGEDTEIDKVMVDALHDPLVHLIRNAIDHGLETPSERAAAGKPPTGRIVLDASHQGGEVLVQVSDDGRGVQRQRVLARARERELLPDSGSLLGDRQILELLFLPGFSTKDDIDEVSGRGVGMDLVKTAVEAQRGHIQLASTEGHGTLISLTLPLTLAFLDAMVVRDKDQLYAVPIEKVREVFTTRENQVCAASAEGKTMLRVRDELVPLLRLGDYYARTPTGTELSSGSLVVVVQTQRGQLAIPVDALLGNQPVMLKPLKGVIASVRAAAGCGMLRSGDVALTLDCDQLHA
ncbi:MAG: chemotaxis protein CheA [Polyangiales bacterium]